MLQAATVKASKRALRRATQGKLQSLPHVEVMHQSSLITAHILSSEIYDKSRSVSCYLSLPGEVDTAPLVLEILRAAAYYQQTSGKALFVPRIEAGGMRMLRIYNEQDLHCLPRGTMGIKEPETNFAGHVREDALGPTAEPLDLILLPGVAFDRSLARLGHGKGYYDQFLGRYQTLRPSAMPFLMGLSLKEQLVPQGLIPMTEYDWSVQAIVTSDELLRDSSEPIHTPAPSLVTSSAKGDI